MPLRRRRTGAGNSGNSCAVKYLGWAFVLLALGLLAYGGKGLYDYLKMTPAQAVTSTYEEPPSRLPGST